MTLSNLIRKGGLAQIVTATSATLVTQESASAATVAQVATVAVAEPVVAMTAKEEMAIRTWLVHIEEPDTDVAEVLKKCRVNMEVRAYFLWCAEEVPRPNPDYDDRRNCAQCINLAPSGLCLAARCGEILASPTYHPIYDVPRRCEGYAPGPDDSDRRPGRERWPGLTSERRKQRLKVPK